MVLSHSIYSSTTLLSPQTADKKEMILSVLSYIKRESGNVHGAIVAAYQSSQVFCFQENKDRACRQPGTLLENQKVGKESVGFVFNAFGGSTDR